MPAAAIRDPRQREDYGVDLVRVRVDPRRALRRNMAAVLIRAAAADKILGVEESLNHVRRHLAASTPIDQPARTARTYGGFQGQRKAFLA